jgi:hypothetical protein
MVAGAFAGRFISEGTPGDSPSHVPTNTPRLSMPRPLPQVTHIHLSPLMSENVSLSHAARYRSIRDTILQPQPSGCPASGIHSVQHNRKLIYACLSPLFRRLVDLALEGRLSGTGVVLPRAGPPHGSAVIRALAHKIKLGLGSVDCGGRHCWGLDQGTAYASRARCTKTWCLALSAQ